VGRLGPKKSQRILQVRFCLVQLALFHQHPPQDKPGARGALAFLERAVLMNSYCCVCPAAIDTGAPSAIYPQICRSSERYWIASET
jgi:hypothetical protein